jgi:hypothetical protein
MKSSVSNPQRNRNRLVLVLIASIFFLPMLVAGIMRFTDHHPQANRQHGELLKPPADLRALSPTLITGGMYRWNPAERVWRIAVAPPADCGTPCTTLAKELNLVTQLFGRHADRVHILWFGKAPDGFLKTPHARGLRDDPALRRGLPRVDDPAGVPVYVIDPNGFVVLRYASGFDPSHLRQDMSRLLKLK